MVGYPILNLQRLFARRNLPRPDLHCYLRDLEEVIIDALAEFGVSGRRYAGYTGVWVDGETGPEKIAAIWYQVEAGPLVRSSYHAEQQVRALSPLYQRQ